MQPYSGRHSNTPPFVMREQSLTNRIDAQVQVEPSKVDLDGLNRPDRVVPGSELQAEVAAAVIGPIDPRPVQTEAGVERSRQEVSQNVEQIRLDIVRGIQGHLTAEAIVGLTHGGSVADYGPSSAVGVGISTINKTETNLPAVREQVIDQIERVQEQLHLLSASGAMSPETQTAIQGRGDFRGNAELRHDAKPQVLVTRADRSENASAPLTQPPADFGRPSESSWLQSIPHNEFSRILHKPVAPQAVVRAHRSFDIISRLTTTSSDIRLVRRIQEGVDLLCYTLFGMVAVGALTGDQVTRFTYRTLRKVLADMRERAVDEDIDAEERLVVEDSAQQLAHALVDLSTEVDKVSASTVADVCGSIVHAEKSHPVPGVIVNGGSLGQAMTDGRGIFVLKNVPFHTSYELTPMHSRYEFFPDRIIGSCVELNFERFYARMRTK